MGISGIIKLLQTHFQPCLREVPFLRPPHLKRDRMKYHNVCLELNYKLHATFRSKAIRSLNNHSNLNSISTQIMQEEIQALQKLIFIKNEFFIAADGCAPLAKMIHQRKSRLFRNELIHSNITPGTLFMNQFSDEFKTFIQKQRIQAKYNILFSDSNTHGEGESKIFQHIQNEVYRKSIEQRDVLVIGVDGDLVLLGLLVNYIIPNYPFHNLDILFCNSSFRYYLPPFVNNSFATNFDHGNQYLISISELQKQLSKIFQLKETDTESLKRISLDFVLFNLLIGNDYVPRMLPTELKDRWMRYVEAKQGPTFANQFLVNLIELPDDNFYFDINIPLLLNIVFSNKASTTTMTYQTFQSVEEGRNQVIEYFQMLNWNLQSYLKPQVKTLYNLCYSYQTAPSASLIEETYRFYGKEMFTQLIQVDLKQRETQPFSMEQYLVGIMPKFAELHVPEHVRPHLTNDSIQNTSELLTLIQNIK